MPDRRFVLPYAEEIVTIFRSHAIRAEIAGSLRRGKEEVKDVEIVAMPPWDVNLEGEYLSTSPTLDALVRYMVGAGLLRWDEEVKRNGPRYKRFRLSDKAGGVALDLFLADRDNWGNTLAIRTGNAAFSKELMISARRHGMKQEGGYLRRIIVGAGDREIVSCPEETDYFAALGVPWIEPTERTDEAAQRLRRGELR